MSTLTKLVLGTMGLVRPRPVQAEDAVKIAPPPPGRDGGLRLMQAPDRRRFGCGFSRAELPLPLLSNLLWAAWGFTRDQQVLLSQTVGFPPAAT